MERFEMEEAARKALAAQLKQSAPGIFGKVPVPSQLVAAAAPAREAKPVPAAPPTHDLVSAIAAIDDARLAHERAQVEAARRAADPIEQANARLDSLTFRMTSDQIADLRECIALARADEEMAFSFVAEVNSVLDDIEEWP